MGKGGKGRGIFVTGTDTGVGKTLVSCALVAHFRQNKIDAVGFKPVASGCVDGRWEDADLLHAASEKCEPLDALCPLRFSRPLAPTLAAHHEQRDVNLDLARKALAYVRSRHAAVVVEGVGGLLVPLDASTLVLDFAREVNFPVLIVCRAALGTINHTLLTVREVQRAGLTLAGIVMNTTRPEDTAVAAETRAEIERIAGIELSAILPYLSPELSPHQRFTVAAAELDRQMKLNGLL